jgi:hypothetical protein
VLELACAPFTERRYPNTAPHDGETPIQDVLGLQAGYGVTAGGEKVELSYNAPASAFLRARRREFLAVDHHKATLSRVATEHQASAHAEAADGAVALHIDLWRFDVVFF